MEKVREIDHKARAHMSSAMDFLVWVKSIHKLRELAISQRPHVTAHCSIEQYPGA
jgi:hypothetical protein